MAHIQPKLSRSCPAATSSPRSTAGSPPTPPPTPAPRSSGCPSAAAAGGYAARCGKLHDHRRTRGAGGLRWHAGYTDGLVAVLADGMGKAYGARIASRTAVETFLDLFRDYNAFDNPQYYFRKSFHALTAPSCGSLAMRDTARPASAWR